MEQEIFYAMALTRLTNFNFQQALALYKAVGSAQLLYEHRHDIGDIVKDASPRSVLTHRLSSTIPAMPT